MHKVAKIETKVNRKGLRRTTTGRVGRQASAAYSCRFVAPQHRQTWRHHQTFPGSSPNIFARGNRQPGGNVFFADKWIREPGTGFHCQGGHGSRFRRPLRDLRAASINGVACIRKRATNPHDRPAGGRKATGIQTQPGRSRATSPSLIRKESERSISSFSVLSLCSPILRIRRVFQSSYSDHIKCPKRRASSVCLLCV